METSEIRWLGKELLKYAVPFVLALLVFRWIDFSVLQSLALAILVVTGYIAYKTVSARAARVEPFSPYQVVIQPKFEELLLDFKLLTNVEQAKSLHALWNKKDQRLISFTVLQDQDSEKDWLIYSNTDNYFFSDMRDHLDEPIEAIVFEGDRVRLKDPTASDDGKWNRSPSFYFRQASGGYELGLQVFDEWWKRMSSAERPNVTTTPDYVCGWERLSIATIPYVAFAPFRAKPAADYERWERVWKEMDSQLERHGWKRQKPDPSAEVRDPWIRIEHEYFKVQYRQI